MCRYRCKISSFFFAGVAVPTTVYRGHLLHAVRPGLDGQRDVRPERHRGSSCSEGLQTDLHHQTFGLAHRLRRSLHTGLLCILQQGAATADGALFFSIMATAVNTGGE